jgi:hypothetical protein
MYGGVDVYIHIFLTSALAGDEKMSVDFTKLLEGCIVLPPLHNIRSANIL